MLFPYHLHLPTLVYFQFFASFIAISRAVRSLLRPALFVLGDYIVLSSWCWVYDIPILILIFVRLLLLPFLRLLPDACEECAQFPPFHRQLTLNLRLLALRLLVVNLLLELK